MFFGLLCTIAGHALGGPGFALAATIVGVVLLMRPASR